MNKIFIFLILISTSLFSIVLTPMTQTIDSKKSKNIIFKITNPSSEPVAVTFDIKKVTLDEEGKEIRETTSKVLYYPSQFVLGGDESKNIRVKYVDHQLPQIEELYRVIATELDINVNDNQEKVSSSEIKATIKMRFSYEGLLFVHENNAKAQLKIDSFEQVSANSLTLVIVNNGTKSVLPFVSDYDYIVKINNKEYKLTENDFKGVVMRRVLAQKRKKFELKEVSSLPMGKIESIRLEKR